MQLPVNKPKYARRSLYGAWGCGFVITRALLQMATDIRTMIRPSGNPLNAEQLKVSGALTHS